MADFEQFEPIDFSSNDNIDKQQRMGEINWDLDVNEPELYLTRQDRKTISRLSEAKGIKFKKAMEEIYELEFSLPYFIEKDGQKVKNPNIDKLGVRLLVRMEIGKETHWFVMMQPSARSAETEELTYKCYSTANQMADVTVRGFDSEDTPRVLSDYLEILVNSSNETYWSMGTVDATLDSKFRMFSFDNGNLLQAVFDLATKFEAVVDFDTVNSKINMYSRERYNSDSRLVVSHDNYLIEATKSEDGLSMATQLSLYGSDNLSINRVNPTGTNYIEDFSFFLDGFEMDMENGGIISSSKYMSDELAMAIVNYSRLVEGNKGLFEEYLDELEELEKSIIPLNIELNDLKTSLKTTKDSIDMWLTQNGGKQNDELVEAKVLLESSIASKQEEMNQVKIRITEIAGASYITDRFIEYGVEGGLMGELKDLMRLENNFTPELLDERAGFIIRKEYSNESIIDDKDLMAEGIKEFERMKEPKLEATMNIVNFLALIEGQRDWDKLVIGDSFKLVVPEIDLNITANISMVNYDFETDNIDVTITNVSRNKTQGDNFLDLIYKANSSANSIQVNKGDWNKGKEANDKVRQILDNVWDATKNKIEGGVYSSIEISDRGILSRDPEDPDNTYLVLLNGLLAITKDGGNSWKNAITPLGVIAERLYGQIITGQNLVIGDADGILQFVGNKGIVSDSDGNMVMKIGLVEEATVVGQADKFGILLFRGDKNKVYLTQEDGLVIQKSTVNGWEDVFSADIEGEFTAKDFSMVNMKIVNANIEGQGVYLDSVDGIRIDGAFLRQIIINADKGIEMLNTTGDRVFYVDSDGNINVRGINILSGNLAGRDVETIGQAIDDVSDAVANLDEYVDGAFKDSLISTTEAKAIATHLETLDNEKADIDAQFASLYSNTSLTGTPKVNLYNAKQDYDSAHVLLKQAINTAITDSKVSATEKTNVDAKFVAYRTALNTMSKRLQEANDEITVAKIEPVKVIAENAQSVAIGADSKAQTAISGVNDISSDMKITSVEKRQLDKLWVAIQSEYTQLVAFGDGLGLSSTNYTIAYQELDGVAPRIQTDILANLTTTYSFVSTTARDNFRAKIINYYNQREIYKSSVSNKQKDLIAEAKFVADNAFSNGELIGQIADDASDKADTALTNAQTAITNAQTAITNAQTAMTNAQGALDGLNTKENNIIKSATAPSSPATGMLWFDISNASLYQLKRWNGSAWITATPTTPAQIGAETNIFKQTTAPSHLDGRLWMDTSVTPNVLKRSNGTAWINTSATTATEVGAEPSMFKQNTAPSHLNGRLWLDTTAVPNKLYRSNGTTWLKVTPTTAGEVGTYTFSEIDTALNNKVSTTTYTVDLNGLNTRITNNETSITQNANQIALKANTSDVDAIENRVDTAEAELVVQANEISQKVSSSTFTTEMATKESNIIKSSTAPTAPATNAMWLDTGFTPNILKRWSGTAWVKVTPSLASEVGAENVVYKQNTAPAHSNGRLWLNTTTSPNIMYRSDGTSWIKTSATTPAEVGAEAVVTKASTAPASPVSGQLWVDTSVVPNILKRWSGSAWVKITPTTPAEIGAFGATEGTQLTTRVTTAEGSITNLSSEISQRVTITDFSTELNKKEGTMFKQPTAPASPVLNTMWLDTSVTPNALKRWDGSAWVKANPTSASDIGAYGLTAGESLNTRLSTAEGTITNLGSEITQRVTITNFNTELAKKQADIPKQSTAPTAVEGAMWLDTSTSPNVLKTYLSGSWVKASATTASEIGAEGVVLKQSTAPAHLNGRLWLDTSVTPNILKRSTGSAWVNATPTTASEVGAEGVILKQSTAPAHLNGRLWTDTSVTPNILKRSDGTNWIKMTPTTASEVGAFSDSAGTSLTSRVSTAEGTITNLGSSIQTKVSTTDLKFTLDSKYGNLVNNISVNNPADPIRWNPASTTNGQATSIVDGDFNGVTIPLLKSATLTDSQVYSDTFEVEPTRAYEFVVWVKSSEARGLNYIGLHAFDNVAPTTNAKNVTPVTLSTGVALAPTNNPYFWSGAKTTSWRKFVGYIFPYGTDPAIMKGLSTTGNAVTTGFIMAQNTNKIRIRLLNYGNAGTNVDTFYAHPKVTDFQPDATIPRLTNAEATITVLDNSITSKVSKVTVDTLNNTGIFKDVLNQRLPNASYTGYMMITTGIDSSNQMSKMDIKGFNYAGSQGLIDMSLSFYAYNTPSFINTSYTSKGSYKVEQVMLAKNASGKVVIIIGKRDSIWEYPQINIPEVTVSFGIPQSSFANGWSVSVIPNLTGLTSLTTVKEGGNGDGVNLIGNSTFNDDFELWEGIQSSYMTIGDAEQDKPTSSILNVSRSGLVADGFTYLASKEVDIGTNAFLLDNYFLSFDMKVMDLAVLADGDTVMMVRMYNGAEDALSAPASTYAIKKSDIVEAGALSGIWKRYTYRLPKTLTGRYLRVSPYLTRNGNVYYREIQVERNGTSGWTQSPTDTNTLMVKVKEVKQAITDDSIISTVRASEAYTDDLKAFLTPEGLVDYSFADTSSLKTAIETLDASLKQYIQEGFTGIKTEYSSIAQTTDAISLAVSTGGGMNKILNSVGWAGTTGWIIETVGSGVTTIQDEPQDPTEAVVLGELESLGSGSAWILQGSTIKQEFTTEVGKTYTFSSLVKKTAGKNGMTFEYTLDATATTPVWVVGATATTAEDLYWAIKEFRFKATSGKSAIRLKSMGAGTDTTVTNLIVNVGDTALQWSNHPTELYTTSARFDRTGLTVSNNSTQNITMITPTEFSGYAPVNGAMKKVFTLNGETTEVKSLDVEDSISIGTIKMLRINSGNRAGVAFLPTPDDDVDV